jgi:hypothetical protein
LRRKGLFRGRGLSGRFCRKRIAISINLIRLRATGIRSPARAHHKGGLPGPLEAIGAAGPWDPPGCRQRHVVANRRTRRRRRRWFEAEHDLPSLTVRSYRGPDHSDERERRREGAGSVGLGFTGKPPERIHRPPQALGGAFWREGTGSVSPVRVVHEVRQRHPHPVRGLDLDRSDHQAALYGDTRWRDPERMTVWAS